ncbi:hypothetical protein DYB38_013052 [Aphanomyces astaci]|uniref:Uncharacterized protein n=1 Tax=Aphanomyces astaci TaxID=112090 RepID=A0A397FEP4_APHAT|nr:hypothetical protein DYB34_013377 [Aphanomyces astaci]RHY73483.1 hypothetical protein DYB38_013052 [Aphanomyces astaci]RHZ23393.1 hypothetical protein DYB31_011891 [Aphanomyces astaci]
MKLLAALVHAAAASQVKVDGGSVVFDSLAPLDNGAKGSPISRGQSVAVQFPTPEHCGTDGLTLEYVNFTLGTLDIPDDKSLWLQAALCPSLRLLNQYKFRSFLLGLPHCTNSDALERIPIHTIAKRATFQVFPSSPIVLEPATTYWFTVHSNRKTKKKSPVWLDGTKPFSTDNDPYKQVLVAYTEEDTWAVAAPTEDRFVPSLQVYVS